MCVGGGGGSWRGVSHIDQFWPMDYMCVRVMTFKRPEMTLKL